MPIDQPLDAFAAAISGNQEKRTPVLARNVNGTIMYRVKCYKNDMPS